jgi:hypothetical protein
MDVTPGRNADNLGPAVLTDIDARIRVDDLFEGLVFARDQRWLAGVVC